MEFLEDCWDLAIETVKHMVFAMIVGTIVGVFTLIAFGSLMCLVAIFR